MVQQLYVIVFMETSTKGETIVAGMRFRGGAIQSLTLPLALASWQQRQTSAAVVAEIDTLLDECTEGQIASILNERGYVSGEGKSFHRLIVQRVRSQYGLKTRYDRLRAAGMLTADEIADLLGVSTSTVRCWHRAELLRGHVFNDKNECLYEPPGKNPPVKMQGRKLSKRRRVPEVEANRTKEMQCEA